MQINNGVLIKFLCYFFEHLGTDTERTTMGKLQNRRRKRSNDVGYFELCVIIKILWDLLLEVILVEQILKIMGFTERKKLMEKAMMKKD